jgi:hypothetical protein
MTMKAVVLLLAVVVVVVVEVEGVGRNFHKKLRGMAKKGKPIMSLPILPIAKIPIRFLVGCITQKDDGLSLFCKGLLWIIITKQGSSLTDNGLYN